MTNSDAPVSLRLLTTFVIIYALVFLAAAMLEPSSAVSAQGGGQAKGHEKGGSACDPSADISVRVRLDDMSALRPMYPDGKGEYVDGKGIDAVVRVAAGTRDLTLDMLKSKNRAIGVDPLARLLESNVDLGLFSGELQAHVNVNRILPPLGTFNPCALGELPAYERTTVATFQFVHPKGQPGEDVRFYNTDTDRFAESGDMVDAVLNQLVNAVNWPTSKIIVRFNPDGFDTAAPQWRIEPELNAENQAPAALMRLGQRDGTYDMPFGMTVSALK